MNTSPRDFVTDNNPTSIYFAAMKVGMPEYVKLAEVITPDEVADLASTAFADPAHRALPVHTKEATWLSAAYFYGMQDDDVAVDAHIKTAAEFHGITEDVAALKEVFSRTKEAHTVAESRHALSVQFAKSGTQKFYPLNSYADVIDSADNMMRDYNSGALPIEYLRTASRELVKAAEDFRVPATELPAPVVKFGAARTPALGLVEAALYTRKAYGMKQEDLDRCKQAFESAESAYVNAVGSPDVLDVTDAELDKIASIDREAGMSYRDVVDPYTAAYTGESMLEVEKMASHNVVISDVVVPAMELVSLPTDLIDRAFAADSAAIVKEAVAAAGTFTPEGCYKSGQLLESLGHDGVVEVVTLLLNK